MSLRKSKSASEEGALPGLAKHRRAWLRNSWASAGCLGRKAGKSCRSPPTPAGGSAKGGAAEGGAQGACKGPAWVSSAVGGKPGIAFDSAGTTKWTGGHGAREGRSRIGCCREWGQCCTPSAQAKHPWASHLGCCSETGRGGTLSGVLVLRCQLDPREVPREELGAGAKAAQGGGRGLRAVGAGTQIHTVVFPSLLLALPFSEPALGLAPC